MCRQGVSVATIANTMAKAAPQKEQAGSEKEPVVKKKHWKKPKDKVRHDADSNEKVPLVIVLLMTAPCSLLVSSHLET
jgi:hypothetical protein